jgi:hypothetical protein
MEVFEGFGRPRVLFVPFQGEREYLLFFGLGYVTFMK